MRVRVQAPTSECVVREYYAGVVGSRPDTAGGGNTTDGGRSHHRKHPILPIPNLPSIIGSPALDTTARGQNTGMVSSSAYAHGVGNTCCGDWYVGGLKPTISELSFVAKSPTLNPTTPRKNTGMIIPCGNFFGVIYICHDHRRATTRIATISKLALSTKPPAFHGLICEYCAGVHIS